ncbi:MAG: purine-binding chemotaxis protein CheW [Ardenticatenales bacterium]|nr:purine-binding chemotaxis protein CheW [Ardenticatenales bacterium]
MTRTPFILFDLAGATYGIPSQEVKQMEMIEQITPVPNAPPSVEGVVYSRGEVIPAMNLRVRFGFETVPLTLRSRLIIVERAGRTVGLIVDSAREFIWIPDDLIQPAPEAIVGVKGRYVEAIATLGNRLVVLIDLDEVLTLDPLYLPTSEDV